MTVYLVRHAVAVGRSSWDGEDRQRPLTKKGQRQAKALPGVLGGADVHRVLTSPAARCRDTVQPLAARLGVDVEDADELAEGASAERAVELARVLATKDGDTVLCTHGDLIPEVLRALARDGMAWDGELRFAKGSTWVLRFDGDRCVDAEYRPPAAD